MIWRFLISRFVTMTYWPWLLTMTMTISGWGAVVGALGAGVRVSGLRPWPLTMTMTISPGSRNFSSWAKWSGSGSAVRVTGQGQSFFVCHIILIKVWWSRSMARSTHSRCKNTAIFSDNYRRKLLNLGFGVKKNEKKWKNKKRCFSSKTYIFAKLTRNCLNAKQLILN